MNEPIRSVMALPEIPSVRAYQLESIGGDLKFLNSLRGRIGWLLPAITLADLDLMITCLVERVVSL